LPRTRVLRARRTNGNQQHLRCTNENPKTRYPLRVDLHGLAADGQAPTQQWQVDAASIAASASLPALLKGEVRVQDLDLVDLAVRLRPRPTPEQDYADLEAFFPVISDRDPDAHRRDHAGSCPWWIGGYGGCTPPTLSRPRPTGTTAM
jgi:hypothetical protein